MNIILKSLHLQSFKGCKDRLINFGDRTSIKGQNSSGKTTIADAINWVLFGKNLDGAKDFDIRPKDSQGNDIDFIDIIVTANLEVDGRPLDITKTQKQKWVTKKGCEERTFQGNENKYEINTIPKSESEFKKYIDELVSEDVFKFVSNTNAFMGQKPNDRRETLFKLVSDVTDSDILATDSKLYNGLSVELSKYKADEIMSRDKKALSEYKKKLDEVPARIDEVSKKIVDMDFSERELELSSLKDKLAEVEEQISDTSKGYEEINQLKGEIAEIKGKMADIERTEKEKILSKRSEIENNVFAIQNKLREVVNECSRIENEIILKQKNVNRNTEFLSHSRKQYTEIKSETFDESTLNCPTCNQPFPEEKKAELLENFINTQKKRLDGVVEQGNLLNESIKKDQAEIDTLKLKQDALDTQKRELEPRIESIKQALEVLPTEINLKENQVYDALENDFIVSTGNLEVAINMVKDTDSRKQALLEQKKSIQYDIQVVQGVLATKQVIEDAKDRVSELQEEQKSLSQKIATVEKEIYLLEEFNKAKVNLLSEKINAHFKVVKWKLFERQINGGYNPICEPMVNGKSYSKGLNSGHKILAELDIISTLQKIYEVQVPVFLDNSERINDYNIPKMDCQLITLSVSNDAELKVEVE